MDSEKCKIKLDSPENAYYAGQEIKGQLSIVLTKKTKIRGIYFKIYGYGKCSWCEFLQRESDQAPREKGQSSSLVYSSKEDYLSNKSYIVGSKSGRPIELDVGTHTYEFSYTLERNLPSTFKGNYGSIKYKMEFIVEKAWNFNDKYAIPITVIKSQPLSPTLSERPLLRQLTRNIGIFGGGPVTLVAELPRVCVVRGNKLTLRVTVDNCSNTHVDKLKFSIRQLVSYISQQPLPQVKREEVIKIFKKETGGIQKKSSRTFEHELQMPLCQPSDITCSNIISIAYECHIDAILPGLYKNMTLALPFEVRSHENTAPAVPQAPHNPNAVVGWITLFPSPNSSVNSLSSMDHSSPSPRQFSELPCPHFSELPSPRFSVLPGTSGSSSYSNSPTATNSSNRSSFRNSFAFSSLPGSAPANLPSTSSRSYHFGTSDLPPPSYEELFGSSPQYPETKPSTSSVSNN